MCAAGEISLRTCAKAPSNFVSTSNAQPGTRRLFCLCSGTKEYRPAGQTACAVRQVHVLLESYLRKLLLRGSLSVRRCASLLRLGARKNLAGGDFVTMGLWLDSSGLLIFLDWDCDMVKMYNQTIMRRIRSLPLPGTCLCKLYCSLLSHRRCGKLTSRISHGLLIIDALCPGKRPNSR